MIAIGTTKGLVLAFESVREMRGVARQLENMAEGIEANATPAPHLYSLRDGRVPPEDMLALLEVLKSTSVMRACELT